jgi:hypothetical protein
VGFTVPCLRLQEEVDLDINNNNNININSSINRPNSRRINTSTRKVTHNSHNKAIPSSSSSNNSRTMDSAHLRSTAHLSGIKTTGVVHPHSPLSSGGPIRLRTLHPADLSGLQTQSLPRVNNGTSRNHPLSHQGLQRTES